MPIIDQAQKALWAVSRKPLEAFLAPVAVLDNALLCRDGSLVTLIEVAGSRSMVGATELAGFAQSAAAQMNAPLSRPGHALQVMFERHSGAQPVREICDRGRAQADELGLDLSDVYDERAARLSGLCAAETITAAAWSRPSALTPAEGKQARKASRRRLSDWLPPLEDSQSPLAALEALAPLHGAWVDSVTEGLRVGGVVASPLSGAAAVRALRAMLCGPSSTAPDWRPATSDNDAPPQVTEPPENGGFPPPLAPQILVREPEATRSTVRIDDRLYAPVDMIVGPRAERPFNELVAAANRTGIPFRATFLVEGGGLAGIGASLARIGSSFLAFSSDEALRVRDSMAELAQVAAESQAVVRLRAGFLTWVGPGDGEDELARRVSRLQRAVEAWGECVCTTVTGDPVESLAASVPGFCCAATAPAARAPLTAALRLLPVGRPAAMTPEASDHVFRTPDGRMLPWSAGGGGDHGLDLVYGVPGRGKSVLMNSLALAHVLQAGRRELPRLAVIDIGPSSSGLISMIREALPHDRRAEAGWFRLRMEDEYAINPLDTPLGCRRPTPSGRAFAEGVLGIILTPPGTEAIPSGLREIPGPALDEAYAMRDDAGQMAEVNRYTPGRDPEVDQALQTHAVRLERGPSWWEVVDALFDAGAPAAAARAQRYAVPVLTDLLQAVRADAVRNIIGAAALSSGEPAAEAFIRILTDASRNWTIMFRPTAFDVSAAKVAAVDLREVATAGSAEQDRQTSAMYMLARHALTREWWMSEEDLALVPPRYRRWHEAKIKEVREAPKRIAYDEYHRTAGSAAVRAQVERDAREARKQRVKLCLASQRLEDFGESIVELATRYWILGAGGHGREVDDLAATFGLSETLRAAVATALTGPGPNGAPALLVGDSDGGRNEQLVVNTPGPIELWALNTAPRDVMLRDRVGRSLPPGEARAALARAFPSGSATSRIDAELRALEGRGQHPDETGVVERLADEVVRQGASPPQPAAHSRAA